MSPLLLLLCAQHRSASPPPAITDLAVARPRASSRFEDHVSLQVQPLDVAVHANQDQPPLVPQPKESLIDRSDPLVIGKDLFVDLPDRVPSVRHDLLAGLRANWDVPGLRVHEGNLPRIFFRLQNIGLPAEGYEIRINRNSALILGQDKAGLRHAVETVVQLFYSRNGKLCLPKAVIRDWPSVSWRGVHLFVGPQALEFQQNLWDRVLRPLKFNNVVLECERTQWKSLPDPKPADYMSPDDLVHLFDYYREIGVEPTPLIQSFGHMDWLFSENQNLDLALYSGHATAIDPRLPKAKELLGNIWDEAISLLHPKNVHFGLDEVAVKWPTKDPGLMTRLWQTQMAQLSDIATTHKVGMMCWGDQCLGPGEAIDANLAETRDDAKLRREAIPHGAYVTDWHYKNDPNPDRYTSSLQLWKEDGQVPIAASWFRPENIRGFTLAAIEQGAGTLQTTWAGKESSADGMLKEFRQFSAMVVAADYAWSGRKDDWDKLGYDPATVFSRMYFHEPSPVAGLPGQAAAIDGAPDVCLGDVQFKRIGPYGLRSLLTSDSNQLPHDLVFDTPHLMGREVAIAMDSLVSADENQPVGELEIQTSDGTITKPIVYGEDVRSNGDTRPVIRWPRANGLSVLRFKLSEKPVVIYRLALHGNSTLVGLRVHGVTAF